MGGVSTSMYNGLKGYWRRRRSRYERLNGSGRRRKNPVVPKLGAAAGSNRKRLFWRVKIRAPKLKLRCFSPKQFFTGIRDAYVNMMLRIANSRPIGVSGYGNGFGGDGSFGTRPVKEYDENMLIELCKSILIARSRMAPLDATRFGSGLGYGR